MLGDGTMQHTFQVDLRGLVELLSHHLYSSPRVYLRELLQNAMDAITARRQLDPNAPARILITPPTAGGDGALRISDTGIGLTEAQVHELLATIGGSAKRDELGFARGDFLGQFGIGLLSCFLVADEIEVVTRSAAEPDRPAVVWRGHSDGRYTVTEGSRAEPGTTVTLRPRRGAEQWVDGRKVQELARHYGELLAYEVRMGEEPVTGREPPWEAPYSDPETRRAALLAYGAQLLGQQPFEVVDLDVPEAGLTGVAFILATEAHPGDRAEDRVYLKRMLLSDKAGALLPEWAFFARCVVNTTELRPTANREQLYDDDLLRSTRKALGRCVRDWMIALSTTAPDRLARFLNTHHRGVMALAQHDEDMLRIVERWVPFATADGPMTLAEYRRRHRRVRYTATYSEFRQVSGIAGAQGVGLINGGYTGVIEVLRRLPAIHPDLVVERFDPTGLAADFTSVTATDDARVDAFLAMARPALERLGCVPEMRIFEPATVPALYLESSGWSAHIDQVAAAEEATGVFAEILGEPELPPDTGPVLMLNYHNALVRRLLAITDPELAGLAVEVLYGQTLLAGHHTLSRAASTAINRSLLGLLDRVSPSETER
jgi:molecular chaperone HtpG